LVLLPLQYAKNVLLWVDQGGNVLLGGAPDETISSRLGRWKDHPSRWRRAIGRPVAAVVDRFLGAGHSDGAEIYERSIIHRPESIGDEPGD
jgi:hypothetical protein